MPRYFFHVTDGRDYPDLQGTEFEDLREARVEAVRFSGRLLSDYDRSFWDGQDWSMRVSDIEGTVLFTLYFSATESFAASGQKKPDPDPFRIV